MAVYTSLEFDDIQNFIQRFDIGKLTHFEGITDGIENSNYLITTSIKTAKSSVNSKRRFVLTLFEELTTAELPFHIDALRTLERNHVPVAAPISAMDSQALHELKGLPAVLCPFLSGSHPQNPSIKQCQSIGSSLADIHNALAQYGAEHQHTGIRDSLWLKESLNKASVFLSESDKLLSTQVFQAYCQTIQNKNLSQSIIHGDLFHDNCLFEKDKLIGIIDFFNAGYGFCLYDLAIVVNDWCLDHQGHINSEHYQELLKSYAKKRPFNDDEKHCWPYFLSVCALRFWISRILAQKKASKNPYSLNIEKDPEQYKLILKQHLTRDSFTMP